MLSSPAHGICSLDVSAHIQFLSSVNQDLGEKKRKQLSTLLLVSQKTVMWHMIKSGTMSR